MKKFTLIVAIGGALLLAGCGDSSSDEAAEKAAAAAEAAQEQVAELQDQVDQQTQELEDQRQAAKAADQRAKKQAQAAARKARQQAQASTNEQTAAESPSEPPNVVGLTLTSAESKLKSAGYRVDAENTDTMFGIVNTDNYTVCTQDPPRGKMVHVLAQKYGC